MVWWALLGLSVSTNMVFLLLVFMLFIGPVTPYTRTILSNGVPHELQARIFAGFSALESIGSLVSPLLTVGYSICVSVNYAGMIFEVMALLTMVAFLLVSYIIYTPELFEQLPKAHQAHASFKTGPSGEVVSPFEARYGDECGDLDGEREGEGEGEGDGDGDGVKERLISHASIGYECPPFRNDMVSTDGHNIARSISC